MWSLRAPGFNEATTLDASRSRLDTAHDRTVRLNAARDDILAVMETYSGHGETSTLHTLVPQDVVAGIVQKSDMEYLYSGGLAKSGGRYIYDAIMGAAPYSRCPYCGHRRVRQLDHFLPKSKYPAFSVTPLNLIPSCSDCNKDKLAGDATQLEDLPLHPYYDNVNQQAWLRAELLEEPTAVFMFNVDDDCDLSATSIQRLKSQFDNLNLSELYTTEANEELASIRLNLRRILDEVGQAGVRAFLEDAALSSEHHQRNSWKTAMYRAASRSDWFCAGGFDDVDLL